MIENDDREILDSSPRVVTVAGGRSARMAAVAVATLLVAVIWIGISGPRPAPTTPTATSEFAAVPTSPADTATGTTAAPASSPPAIGIVVPDDVFGAYLRLGDNQYLTILFEPSLGHLTGRLQIPVPPPAVEGTFGFQQFSAPAARGQLVHIADWPMSVEALHTITGRTILVIDEYVSAQPRLASAPRPVMSGYWLRVGIRGGATTATIEIDVRIGESPTEFAGYRRGRGLYNRCRWDLSPISAQPAPGVDEASC